MEIGINVVLCRLFWGLVGGKAENKNLIKTILIDLSLFIWGLYGGKA